MKRSEAAALLGVIQTFDHRTVGEPDVIAWADVLDDLTPQECLTAVRDHYRRTTEWLMPAHIREYVLMVRRDAAEREHSERLHLEYVAAKQAARGLTRA